MSLEPFQKAPDAAELTAASLLRAGVPRKMAVPTYSLVTDFGPKVGEWAKGWCGKARAFFDQGNLLHIGSLHDDCGPVAARLLFGLARGLTLSRIACRVVPLSIVANCLAEPGSPSLGELEDLDVLIVPDFHVARRDPPFDRNTLSRIEGWLFAQATRAGQGFILASGTAQSLMDCSWWSPWLTFTLADRATSVVLADKGTSFELRA